MNSFSLLDLVRSEQTERRRHTARARGRHVPSSRSTTYVPFVPPDRRVF